MKLLELFTDPYKLNWTEHNEDEIHATFTTDQDTEVTVAFDRMGLNLWNISFDAAYWDHKNKVHVKTFLKTGQGDAPRIFATVIAATQEFVNKYKPKYLWFTASHDEPSRIKLYNTMAKRFAQNQFELIEHPDQDPELPQYVRRQLGNTQLSSRHFVLRNKSFATVKEVNVDNRAGAGAVPDNLNVDYLGLRVQMKPSMFLKLAAKLSSPQSATELANYIKQGGTIGAPFLDIDLPAEWFDDTPDYDKPARIVGHEGRNRMIAVQQVEGDNPVEVHLFFRGGLRRRHLTPEIIERLQSNLGGIRSQDKNLVVDSPLFSVENKQNLNELFDKPYQSKWVKKTKDNTDAVFTTQDGTEITVSFNNTDNMTTIGFEAKYFDQPSGQTIITFLATGKGDAPRIFATILSAIKQFINEKKPNYLFFTSLEPSRTKLYNTMVRTLGTDYSRLPITAIDKMQTTDKVKRILANYAEELPPDEMFILERKSAQPLKELFAKPYKFEGSSGTYTFETASGNQYTVLFEYESVYDKDSKQWFSGPSVVFGLTNRKHDFSMKVEKTGDAFNVFATVSEIVKQYLSQNRRENYLIFAAAKSEPSRLKLYNAFMKMLPQVLPEFVPYKIIDDFDNELRFYILTKKGRRY